MEQTSGNEVRNKEPRVADPLKYKLYARS